MPSLLVAGWRRAGQGGGVEGGGGAGEGGAPAGLAACCLVRRAGGWCWQWRGPGPEACAGDGAAARLLARALAALPGLLLPGPYPPTPPHPTLQGHGTHVAGTIGAVRDGAGAPVLPPPCPPPPLPMLTAQGPPQCLGIPCTAARSARRRQSIASLQDLLLPTPTHLTPDLPSPSPAPCGCVRRRAGRRGRARPPLHVQHLRPVQQLL
jgi:hypothetical protein